MNANAIIVKHEELVRAIQDARSVLKNHFNLSVKDEREEALTSFIGAYTVVREALGKVINGQYPHKHKEAFLDMYSVAVASKYANEKSHDLEKSINGGGKESGLGKIGRKNLDVDDGKRIFDEGFTLHFEQEDTDPTIRRKRLLHDALKVYNKKICEETDKTGNTKEKKSGRSDTETNALFGELIKKSGEAAKQPEYSSIRSFTDGFTLNLDDTEFDNVFDSSTISQIRVKEGDWSLDDIVGNEEAKKTLQYGMAWLAEYKLKNDQPIDELIDLPRTINLYGPPGTGKSSTISAVYSWAKKNLLSGRELELVQISNRVKTKYFSESAKNIDDLFDEIEKGERSYMVVIDDVDLVIHGREQTSQNPEEQNILETMMRRLEGLTSSKGRNYIIVTTSNRPIEDSALDQRLSQKSVAVPGPENALDCSRILEKKLEKGLKAGYVDIDKEALLRLGTTLYDNRMVGRDIRNIAFIVYEQSVESALSSYAGTSNPAEKSALDGVGGSKRMEYLTDKGISLGTLFSQAVERGLKIRERDVEEAISSYKRTADSKKNLIYKSE